MSFLTCISVKYRKLPEQAKIQNKKDIKLFVGFVKILVLVVFVHFSIIAHKRSQL